MYYTPIVGSTRFHELLAEFDRDLAEAVRARGCPVCGGPLDVSNYERKPRGGPRGLPPSCRRRNSLCCRVDGCRKRRTPPSVLFLDRRVFTGTAVVLISALAEGATPRRMHTLRRMIGVSARTVARWRQWWRDAFPASDIGQLLRSRLAGGLPTDGLPRHLLGRTVEVLPARVVWVLRLLGRVHDL